MWKKSLRPGLGVAGEERKKEKAQTRVKGKEEQCSQDGRRAQGLRQVMGPEPEGLCSVLHLSVS